MELRGYTQYNACTLAGLLEMRFFLSEASRLNNHRRSFGSCGANVIMCQCFPSSLRLFIVKTFSGAVEGEESRGGIRRIGHLLVRCGYLCIGQWVMRRIHPGVGTMFVPIICSIVRVNTLNCTLFIKYKRMNIWLSFNNFVRNPSIFPICHKEAHASTEVGLDLNILGQEAKQLQTIDDIPRDNCTCAHITGAEQQHVPVLHTAYRFWPQKNKQKMRHSNKPK